MSVKHLGAQLYTVRDFMKTEEDFMETMGKIKEIGYLYVQVSGIGAVSPACIKEASEKYNLPVVLTHSNPTRIINDTEAIIAEHDMFGCNAIGVGSMGNYTHDTAGFMKFAEDFSEASKKIKAAGKVLLYHNHGFEFERFDGKLGIDILLENTDPDAIKLTFDTFWAQHAGIDPADFIEKHGDRIHVTHLKDMMVKNGAPTMAEVLNGNMNFDRILEACDKAGIIWHMVEQDTCPGNPFDSLKMSFDNLTARYEFN